MRILEFSNFRGGYPQIFSGAARYKMEFTDSGKNPMRAHKRRNFVAKYSNKVNKPKVHHNSGRQNRSYRERMAIEESWEGFAESNLSDY